MGERGLAGWSPARHGTSYWLSAEAFSAACEALPLVSLDLCLNRPGPQGPELLLGLRTNPPARGFWVHAGRPACARTEPMANAFDRLARDELEPAGALAAARRVDGRLGPFLPPTAPSTSTFRPTTSTCRTGWTCRPRRAATLARPAAAMTVTPWALCRPARPLALAAADPGRDRSISPCLCRTYAEWVLKRIG